MGFVVTAILSGTAAPVAENFAVTESVPSLLSVFVTTAPSTVTVVSKTKANPALAVSVNVAVYSVPPRNLFGLPFQFTADTV